MELPDWIVWVVLLALIVIAILGAIAGLTWLGSQMYSGAKYDVTVTVQAVEHSSRFGEHTNLWVQVYGEQDITYTLIGYHDFNIGKQYRVVFVDEPYLIYFVVWWYEVRGRVVSIEQI